MDWLKSLRTKFVDDVSAIWRRWSVKIVAAQAILIATWAGLSAVSLTPAVPEWAKWLTLLVFSAAALTAATLKQPNLPNAS